MSATDAQEELEEVQADLKKREDEVSVRSNFFLFTNNFDRLNKIVFSFVSLFSSLKKRLSRPHFCPMWKVVS